MKILIGICTVLGFLFGILASFISFVSVFITPLIPGNWKLICLIIGFMTFLSMVFNGAEKLLKINK